MEMSIDLPDIRHFDDFYIWFNKDEKKEYYSTPMYFYKADFSYDFNDREKNNNKNGRNKGGGIRHIRWKEDERTDMGLKQPGTLYFPYVERLGLLLLRFLNADLSTYETAYKDFFYAYGFETLKDIDEDYKFELKGKYEDDETYLKETKKIYDILKEQIIYIQEQIIDAVNYIYNINENGELKPFTYSQRYAVYLIKRKGKLYAYIKNDEIIADNYSNKYDELGHMSDNELLKKL